MPESAKINLLPQEEFSVSLTGRILHWAMSTFRIIVIVTEMIVMAAFLSRFWLDAQNSDLNNAIKVQSAQIAAQSGLRNEFRVVQSKVNIFKEIGTGVKPAEVVDTITQNLPTSAGLTTISISSGTVTINGTSGDESGISQFITNLKTGKTLKGIALTGVNSSIDNPSQTNFSIKATY